MGEFNDAFAEARDLEAAKMREEQERAILEEEREHAGQEQARPIIADFIEQATARGLKPELEIADRAMLVEEKHERLDRWNVRNSRRSPEATIVKCWAVGRSLLGSNRPGGPVDLWDLEESLYRGFYLIDSSGRRRGVARNMPQPITSIFRPSQRRRRVELLLAASSPSIHDVVYRFMGSDSGEDVHLKQALVEYLVMRAK